MKEAERVVNMTRKMLRLYYHRNITLWTLFLMSIVMSSVARFEQTVCVRFNRRLHQHQCQLTPIGSEGPVYLTNQIMRRNIREDRAGLPLRLRFVITDVSRCEPMPGVLIDIWHADSFGYYSSYLGRNPDVPSNTTTHVRPTDNTTFLRGVQITDRNGAVEFDTIFPGFYAGRAPHIHLMAHLCSRRVYMGQFYFNDNMIERVIRNKPYSLRKQRRVRTPDDWIYRRDRGFDTTLNARPLRGNNINIGLIADMVVGINPHQNVV